MSPDSEIRLIVLDVDGTLVNDRKEVPPVNLRALKAAREKGVEIAIGSGRMIPSIELLQDRLDGLDCALIAYNGGKVVGKRSERRPVIAHRPLPADLAAELIDFGRERGLPVNFYHDDLLQCDRQNEGNPLVDIYHGRTGSVFTWCDLDEFKGREPTKLIILAEPQERNELYREFAEKLMGVANVMKTDPEYLEFMALGVDKSTALPALAEHLDCEISQILAVGDADNDAQMLQEAGVGVAVANANDSILDLAPHITERTNNEGAVAEAVDRFVFGGQGGFFD